MELLEAKDSSAPIKFLVEVKILTSKDSTYTMSIG
jgi:hypothetical protein